MKQTSNPQNDMNTVNERLARAFYSSRRYNPPLLALAGMGFIAIFLLTSSDMRILGEPAPQLLYIGLLTLLFAIAEIPILALAQQNKGIAANLYATVIGGLFAIVVTLLWQESWPITIVIAAVTPVLAVRNGMPRKYIWRLLWIAIAVGIGIYFAETRSPVPSRLQNSNSAAIASITFLLAIVL